MNVMKLKNMENGSDNRVFNYNTLNGILLKKTGLSVTKDDSSEIVKKKVLSMVQFSKLRETWVYS